MTDPVIIAALKAAQHALIPYQGLRATDQTVEQFDTKVAAGIPRSELEFTLEDEATLDLLDQAIAHAERAA